jgi:propanediol dehydratase small subunit
MNHPVTVEGYDDSLEHLARAIGKMRYDKIAEILRYLAEDLERQSEGDRAAGRVKLAAMLHEVGGQVGIAKEQMDKIWNLCEPYMKSDEKH